MSDSFDKELDEIVGLINKDQTKRPSTIPREQTPVQKISPTSQSRPMRTSKANESERLRRMTKRRKQRQIRRWAIAGGAVALILLIVLLIFKSCAGGDVLKGTWDMDGTTMYQFEGDGEGSMILPYNTYSFQYTIDEKKQTVSIDFDDEKANDYTYNYKISEDKLILFGSEGKESFEFVFTKISDK